MAASARDSGLAPAALERGQLSSLNTFCFWSRKLARRVLLVGPTQFDAALILEFDPEVVSYCERPPLRVDILPRGSKKFRTLDFWVERSRGRQNGLLVFESSDYLSEDLLRRSLADAQSPWDIWLAADLQRRPHFVRNLKQLRPYVSQDDEEPKDAQRRITEWLAQYREGPWGQIQSASQVAHASTFARAMALLYHAGTIALDIGAKPLSAKTWVALL